MSKFIKIAGIIAVIAVIIAVCYMIMCREDGCCGGDKAK